MRPGGVRAVIVGPDNQTARADLADQHPGGNRVTARIDGIRHPNVVRHAIKLRRLAGSNRRGNARRKFRAVVLRVHAMARTVIETPVERIRARDRDGCSPAWPLEKARGGGALVPVGVIK